MLLGLTVGSLLAGRFVSVRVCLFACEVGEEEMSGSGDITKRGGNEGGRCCNSEWKVMNNSDKCFFEVLPY